LPGHDINYLAVAGALSVVKDRDGKPVVPSNILADMAGGGMQAARFMFRNHALRYP
jgi:alpha-methylacyl-CoA racemase